MEQWFVSFVNDIPLQFSDFVFNPADPPLGPSSPGVFLLPFQPLCLSLKLCPWGLLLLDVIGQFNYVLVLVTFWGRVLTQCVQHWPFHVCSILRLHLPCQCLLVNNLWDFTDQGLNIQNQLLQQIQPSVPCSEAFNYLYLLYCIIFLLGFTFKVLLNLTVPIGSLQVSVSLPSLCCPV